MLDFLAIRSKAEKLPITSGIETSYGQYSHGKELVIRIWAEDDSTMVVYSMPSNRSGHVYTIYNDESKNIYESELTSEEVLEKFKSYLLERGINYDNI